MNHTPKTDAEAPNPDHDHPAAAHDPVETGRIGGKARAARLSPKRRSEIAAAAAAAMWTAKRAVAPQVVHAKNVGVLKIGGAEIACAVLEDGRRVLSEREMIKALGRANAGGQTYLRRGADQVPIYLAAKVLRPYFPEGFQVPTVHYIPFGKTAKTGTAAIGVEASTLPVICQIWTDAWHDGKLRADQHATARRADAIRKGLEHIGIIALVDEATGYEVDRVRGSLAAILEAFIDKELAAWCKTFPDEYYVNLCRLKKMPHKPGSARPGCFGGLTNNIVYERLAPGILDELRRINPIRESGQRSAKHHQWLTRQTGYLKLRDHLAKAVTLMEVTSTWEEFLLFLDRFAPRVNRNLSLAFPLPKPSRLSALDDEPTN